MMNTNFCGYFFPLEEYHFSEKVRFLGLWTKMKKREAAHQSFLASSMALEEDL